MQQAFPPPQVQPPVRPSWNPVEEARRRAELEAAQAAPPPPTRGRKKGAAPKVDVSATQQIRVMASQLAGREQRKLVDEGQHHAVMVPRAITVAGFFLGFVFPAVFLYLNKSDHAPLVDGAFEPDEFATRVSVVLLGGGAICMLVGWLWWGVMASLNAARKAKWALSPWFVPLTYVGVAVAALAAGTAKMWLGDAAIYAWACAAAFGVMMYFNTLSTFKKSAEGVGADGRYWGRLIVWPWITSAAAGILAWFWHYLPPQAVLGAVVAAQLIHGLYGLWMYQAMLSFDRGCAGTRQMRQDNQDFAKFFKAVG